jgi:hypothetical protein
VDLRRPAPFRLRRIGHRRQHFVLDVHLLRRVPGLGQAIGDDHGDRIADVTDLFAGERRMRRHLHRRAVLGMDHPAADEVADLVGGEIRAGEHRNARPLLHRRGIHLDDLGVRMRRANEPGMALPRATEVVGIVPPAGDEPNVFLAAHRRADPGRAHGVPPSALRFKRMHR